MNRRSELAVAGPASDRCRFYTTTWGAITIDCGGVKPRDIAVGPDGAWVIGYDEKVVVHIAQAGAGFRSEQKQMKTQPNAVTSWRGAVWMLDSEGALSRLSE